MAVKIKIEFVVGSKDTNRVVVGSKDKIEFAVGSKDKN